MKIVLASNNPGKIREFSELFVSLDIELIPQATLGIADVAETGLSFIENALIKARHASYHAKLPAIADDSGIVVSALKGAPGIYSARYAGEKATAEDNINQLLTALKDVPESKRQAYFHCTLAFMSHDLDPIPLICEGQIHGMITHAPRGQHGHGYDPIFYIQSEQKTAAELSPEIKNKISHRGIALQLLLASLPRKL